MSPFTLLRLPFVALEDVLKSMGLIELYKICGTSKKVRILIRNFVARNYRFKISLAISDRYNLFLLDGKNNSQIFTDKQFLEEQITYHKNFITVFIYFAVNPVGHVLRITKKSPDYIKEIMSHFLVEKLKFEHLDIETSSPSDEILENTLEHFKDASSVRISCETSPGYQLETKNRSPFSIKQLTIEKAKWVTLRHLNIMFKNCEALELKGTNLKSFDFIAYFRTWVKGGLNLEYANISYENVLFPTIMEAVPGATQVAEVTMDDELHEFAPRSCYLIKQAVTGKPAIVYYENDEITLTTDFQL